MVSRRAVLGGAIAAVSLPSFSPGRKTIEAIEAKALRKWHVFDHNVNPGRLSDR